MNLVRAVAAKVRWALESSRIRFGGEQRHWVARNEHSAQVYWENRADPNNQFLYDALGAVGFESALEIGANCGNRLFQLATAYPRAKLFGVDINEPAVRFGNEQYHSLGIRNVTLSCEPATQLSQWQPDSVDIVFSWATLMYLHPSTVADVLRSASRLARKALVLIELHDPTLRPPRKAKGVLVPPRNWIRNYEALLSEVGVPFESITVKPVPQAIWAPSGGQATAITAIRESS